MGIGQSLNFIFTCDVNLSQMSAETELISLFLSDFMSVQMIAVPVHEAAHLILKSLSPHVIFENLNYMNQELTSNKQFKGS